MRPRPRCLAITDRNVVDYQFGTVFHCNAGVLERLLDRMERDGQSGGSDWVSRHQQFHALIFNLSQRPKLIRQITALHVVIEPYMRIWFDYVNKPLSAREEHQTLIDALRSGDPDHAEAVMREHIIATADLLADYASPGR